MNFVLFLLLTFSLQFTPTPKENNPEELATISLREGIRGGFAGPRLKLELDFKPEGKVVSVIQRRPHAYGKSYLSDYPGQALVENKATISRALYELLLQDISPIWTLPLENPEAGDDIYKMDISVRVATSTKTWRNQAPRGCEWSDSTAKPTAEQHKTFQKIVGRIRQEADRLFLPEVYLQAGIRDGKAETTLKLALDFAPEGEIISVRSFVVDGNGTPIDPLKPDQKARERKATISREQYQALLNDIMKIWTLPAQEPDTFSDIYKLDTEVRVTTPSKTWHHYPIQLYSEGLPESKVKPTEEQLKTFQEIVVRIQKEADQLFLTEPVKKKD